MDNLKTAKRMPLLPGELPKEAFLRLFGREAIGVTPTWGFVEDIPAEAHVVYVWFGEKLYVYG